MSASGTSAKAVSRSSPVPVYVQIVDLLLEDIRSRQLQASEQPLPSENELCRRFNASRVTVRQALQDLENKGVIYRERGKGSFVTRSRIEGISGFASFTDEVTKTGHRPGSRILDCHPVYSLPPEMMEHFHVDESDGGFYFLQRLRLIDDVPVAVEDAYLPLSLYPGIDSASFDGQSLYRTIAERWGIVPVWADALIEAIPASQDQADILDVPVGVPLLAAWRVAATQTDDVIEYVKSTYRGNRFLFNIGRHRISSYRKL